MIREQERGFPIVGATNNETVFVARCGRSTLRDGEQRKRTPHITFEVCESMMSPSQGRTTRPIETTQILACEVHTGLREYGGQCSGDRGMNYLDSYSARHHVDSHVTTDAYMIAVREQQHWWSEYQSAGQRRLKNARTPTMRHLQSAHVPMRLFEVEKFSQSINSFLSRAQQPHASHSRDPTSASRKSLRASPRFGQGQNDPPILCK